MLRIFTTWLLVLFFAFINGALRELVLIPALGRTSGFALSGIFLATIVAVISYGFVRITGRTSVKQCTQAGAVWLLLTLAFEFGFGRLVQHKTWSELLAAYAFRDGNLWLLVLSVVLLSPLASGWLLRGRKG